MIHPIYALAAFAALVAISVVLLWPRRGLIARIRRIVRQTDRVRTEDAIKYLFHAGADGAVRPEALAGVLGVRQGLARQILAHLAVRGVARVDGVGYALTDEGRRDALRLVRAHRLLERWLADQTGVDADEWHVVAEDAEHELTVEQTEALAARLGHPRFDPHGDPIPTADGELPSTDAEPLGALDIGASGVVEHLEDEPAEEYAVLRRAGLRLGASVVVHERDAAQVRISVDGERVTLPRALEPAVSVSRRLVAPTRRPQTLAALTPGETARVRGIAQTCAGAQRRRLLDLGVVPGTEITAVLRSASGDPIAYRIRGALIALRRHQAEWIEIDHARAATQPEVA